MDGEDRPAARWSDLFGIDPHYGDVAPWDEAPVTVPRGLLAVLLEAAGKADEAQLLGECPSDPCPICTALVEVHEALYPGG